MKWKLSPDAARTTAAAPGCFRKLGWEVARRRGSHIILTKPGHPATLSVPDHSQVARGTLRALIARAGLTVEEFLLAARA